MLASLLYIKDSRLTITSHGLELKANFEIKSVEVMGFVKLKLDPRVSTHSNAYQDFMQVQSMMIF